MRATKFVLMNEVLYKRRFFQPYLRCLNPDKFLYVLRDVHEGACGNHLRARSLVYKMVCTRYYWPSMHVDAKAYIKACDKGQRYINIPRQPSEYLTPIVAPQPFAQQGLDILGPFPMGTRQMRFLVVGIDYFTKWVKAEPMARIIERNVRNFIQKNIICRFEIPRVRVLDNRRQFNNTPFREFCEQLGIRNHYSPSSHPQVNGQADIANKSLLKIIKTRLEGAKGIWLDELPSVLQAYRTTVRTQTRESSFKLAYRSDAVILVKVGLTNYRVAYYNNKENQKQLRLNLDLIDKVRMDVEQRVAHYKNLMTKHHDTLVRPRKFNIRDLILKMVSRLQKTPLMES